MPLYLKVTSQHQKVMGDDAERVFDGHGGVLGRGLQSDWILPDEARFISGKHAVVDYKSGAYFIVDVSTNGVYMNDEDEPLGRGNYRRLFSGDRLRMGDFEFLVGIDEGEDIEIESSAPRSGPNGHMDQLVEEDSLRTGIQLLDEEELTGDGEFQSALFGTTRMDADQIARETTVLNDSHKEPPNPFDESAPKGPQADELINAFLQGAGVRPEDIHPALDMREVMLNAGQVLRAFVNGTMELLEGRANAKSMFRLDQTTVLPRHNNPMKLAESSADSMKQLLVGKQGEYLGPLDSVREVCRDLKFHQDAMLEGMIAAYRDFAARFDPTELQEAFDRNSKGKPLFDMVAKKKYWQLYCELYPIMTQHGNGPFPQHMADEFVRAYEKYIAESKRSERADGEAA